MRQRKRFVRDVPLPYRGIGARFHCGDPSHVGQPGQQKQAGAACRLLP